MDQGLKMTLPVDTKAIMLAALGGISDREPGVKMAWGESNGFDVIFIVRELPDEPLVFDLSIDGQDYDVVVTPRAPTT